MGIETPNPSSSYIAIVAHGITLMGIAACTGHGGRGASDIPPSHYPKDGRQPLRLICRNPAARAAALLFPAEGSLRPAAWAAFPLTKRGS